MKNKFLHGAAALALCAGVVSCSDYDQGLSDTATNLTAQQEAVVKEYTANFTARYGAMDPNHTWGFGTSSMSSRAMTRGANAGDGDSQNQALWKSFGADNLENITDEERQAVLDAIAAKVTTPKSRISEEVVFPWENYFLQDVISGQNGSWTGAGSNGTSSSSYFMEAFCKGATECANWHSGNEKADYVMVTNSAHMNNYFLKGTAQERIEETTLMTGMTVGTYDEMKERQFRWYINCHENLHWSEYITVQVNGNWYICFDFGCGYPENDKDGHAGKGAEHNDWDYNDWIIKITEGVPAGGQQTPVWDGKEKEETVTYRIMCEDLGNTNDFDFNDLVFDVLEFTQESGQWYASVKVQAAGGTLPIYIGEVNDAHEAHKILGAENTSVALNVGGATGVEAEPIKIAVKSNDLTAIKVYVQDRSNEAGSTILLKNATNNSTAPQMICVPTTVKWMKESQQIEKVYVNFDKWVGNEAGNETWYETTENENLLY